MHQLNARGDGVRTLTSKSSAPPSRGEILKALKALADSAGPDDCIVFFFSGHGHRLAGSSELFLVPQDVYSDEDQGAFLPFSKVKDVLSGSLAKQKIVFLDACFSGPDTSHLKTIPPMVSATFLKDYLAKTTGVVVMSSPADAEASSGRSPNPKLSTFAHFLVAGLRGVREALENQLLTVSSLCGYVSLGVQRSSGEDGRRDQGPILHQPTKDEIVLGDFSGSIISPDSFDLDGKFALQLAFTDSGPARVVDYLTNIRNWTYSADYLAERVNGLVGKVHEEDLGGKVAALRKRFGWSEVGVDDNSIAFPAGTYSIRYEHETKLTGTLIQEASFESEWFGRHDDIKAALHCLDVRPREMTIQLAKSIAPESTVSGLEAKGWSVDSQLRHKVEASHGAYALTLEQQQIRCTGFSPDELFGSDADEHTVSLMAGAMALLVGQ